MAKKRWRILFEGRVQGVGFRFTTQHKARVLGLRGWVKNLPDGRVETEVEGEEETLNKLLQSLQEAFSGFIYSYSLEEKPYKGEFENFRIRF